MSYLQTVNIFNCSLSVHAHTHTHIASYLRILQSKMECALSAEQHGLDSCETSHISQLHSSPLVLVSIQGGLVTLANAQVSVAHPAAPPASQRAISSLPFHVISFGWDKLQTTGNQGLNYFVWDTLKYLCGVSSEWQINSVLSLLGQCLPYGIVQPLGIHRPSGRSGSSIPWSQSSWGSRELAAWKGELTEPGDAVPGMEPGCPLNSGLSAHPCCSQNCTHPRAVKSSILRCVLHSWCDY